MKKFSLFLLLSLLLISSAFSQKITGVLGAFPPELVLLRSKMENRKDTVIARTLFSRGMLNGKPVVLAQTGIGKVNAAITTSLLIEHFKPEEIVFSGIAGGIDTSLNPGDIVIGTQVTYHDYGALEDIGMIYTPTKNPYDMAENPIIFNCDSALIQKAVAISKDLKFEKVKRGNGSFSPSVTSGVVVTGDVFVASEAATRRLRKDLNAAVTEMEGAAIAQTCYQQKVPFLIIRSLSDNANKKATDDVKHFYQIAAENAAIMVMGILGRI